ncbi:MAG: ABC transporter permease [Planctomycetes bacterium]|nr:ABC transporter permease [Planctomycetota bacterium]
MKALLRYFSLRHSIRHPLRVALGAAAIALGVALYVSVDAANSTVARSFERSMSDLAGKAELQVTTAGGLGVDAAALEKIRDLPGVIASPIVQRSLSLNDLKDGSLLVLGIDFGRDAPIRMYTFDTGGADAKEFVTAAFVPNSIIVTKRFAEKNGLARGSKVRTDTPRGRATLVVTGLMENEGPAKALGGNFAVMPLHAAQSLFGIPRRFDRIEVAPDGIDVAELRKRVKAALGDGYDVKRLSRKSTTVEVALARMKSMVVISAIALVVGLFIIYNSVSISVVERTHDIGILRSIGAGRRSILATVVLEWTGVGLLGSAGGVVAGWALSRALVDMVPKSANMLTFAVKVEAVEFSPRGAAIAIAAGTLAAALAALIPGIGAMRITPIDLLRQGTYTYRAAPAYLKTFGVGAFMIAAAAAALYFGEAAFHPTVHLALTTVSFFAIALCGPQATIWVARATRPLLRKFFRIEGYLAADNVSKFPQRTALTVVAFGGAIAVMVASATLVRSMKTASERWMRDAFPFDLSVNATDLSQAIYSTASYGEDVLEKVRKVEGVEAAYGVRAAFLPFDGLEIMLIAVDTDEYFAMHRARGGESSVRKFDTPEFRSAFMAGECIVVSENFARLLGLSPGDPVELPTPQGPRSFTMRASMEDYSWPAGSVLMDRGAYKRIWGDPSITYTDIRVVPGTSIELVRPRVAVALKDTSTVFLYDVPQLQKVGQDAMDQALALAHVQVVIALVIGFLGIVNTLLISVLRRTREIGLLRAVGTTRAQIRRGVIIESVFIAVMGSAVGIAAGLVGAAWPMRLYILRMAGFWFPFTVPWDSIGVAVGAGAVLGVIASIVPARRAAGLNVLDAIGYE